MNKSFNRGFAALTVVILLMSMAIIPSFAGTPSEPHAGNAMWIEPSQFNITTASYSKYDTFEMTVWLNITSIPSGDGTVVAGWQFCIVYDKTLLKALSCHYSEGSISQFFEDLSGNTVSTSATVDGSFNGTHNYCLQAEGTYFNSPWGTIPRAGALSVITFEIEEEPAKLGEIKSKIELITTGTKKCSVFAWDIVGSKKNEITDHVTFYNAEYNYKWFAPPKPFLTPSPVTQTFGPYENVTGKLFNVSVILKNLYSAWYLVNASLTLTYNSTLLEVHAVQMNTGDWDVHHTFDNTTAGALGFFVETSSTLSGDVLIAKVTFKILYQGVYPRTDVSPLGWENVLFKDHTLEIPPGTHVPGTVTIIGFLTMAMPKLEVSPATTTLGPEPVVCHTFDVNVNVKDLNPEWKMVGVEFRLSYDPSMLEVVSVTPGPFLNNFGNGKIVLTGVTIPARVPPKVLSEYWWLIKINITSSVKTTFKFTKYPAEVTISPSSWTVQGPAEEFLLLYAYHYKDYDVTGDYEITVSPSVYKVNVAITDDINLYMQDPTVYSNYTDWQEWLWGVNKSGYLNPHHWDLMDWYVTDGSLYPATFAKIWNCTAPFGPWMYNDTGNVPYQRFCDNKEMCDSNMTRAGDNPDLWTIPWVRNWPWPPYSIFVPYVESDGLYGPHILVGNVLLPHEPPTVGYNMFPGGSGTIAVIKFHVIDQEPEDLTCTLGFLHAKFIDKDNHEIPSNITSFTNGTVIIKAFAWPGRVIDLTGGAVNRGYGVTYGTPAAFPAPYGGQGPNGNMDLVIPQSVVYLLADVTYNWWPVQSKDVGYEIEGPFEQEGWSARQPVPRESYFVRKYSNRTDTEGVAWIKFQMPWPCESPEDYFGKYKVTATVDICGVVVNDTMWFDYYYLVEITKVTTDKPKYWHDEDVGITIEFRSKAQQEYPVLFSIVIQDELETAFGYAYIETSVSGAEFCHWKEYATDVVTINIPKWAFAGRAKILVSAFDKDPTVGGAPWCPTFGIGWPLEATVPEIWILPG
jgi:hypothetical protein